MAYSPNDFKQLIKDLDTLKAENEALKTEIRKLKNEAVSKPTVTKTNK